MWLEICQRAIHSHCVGRDPVRRVCKAHEVAELVYWLSSEAASYVTGVAVPIDGGFLVLEFVLSFDSAYSNHA